MPRAILVVKEKANGEDLDEPTIISVSLPKYLVNKLKRRVLRDQEALSARPDDRTVHPEPPKAIPSISSFIREQLEYLDKRGEL